MDWVAKLRHLLQTLAFCLTISAVQVAFMPDRPYIVPATFSLSIGISTWALVDFGRHLLPSSAGRGWPQGPMAVGLPLLGIVGGYFIGTAVADGILGLSSWSAAARPRLAGSILITLLAGIAGTYYFYSRDRSSHFQRLAREERSRAGEARLKLLESQLEPHMLFNTLANLRVLIGLDPPRAQEMLDRLIGFLRSTLDASRARQHPLSAEFDRLADYLALMAVRMGPRLQVKLDLPADLRELPVPPLLLQPLVENAIKHGLEPKVEGGRIEVRASRVDEQLRLVVRDTGIGLAGPADAGSRFGLEQVRGRLQVLHGDAASLTLRAAVDSEGGAEVEIRMPLSNRGA